MKKDYLSVNSVSRPILSIYELSSSITSLAQMIYEDDELNNYISTEDQINDLLNPAEIATELLFNGVYDAYINRDSSLIKFSDLYLNEKYKELLTNYFSKQHKIIHNLILKQITPKDEK